MNGRDVLLILAHLFRKCGDVVDIEYAVEYLSFRCRYGTPTNIRKMFSAAVENELISRDGNSIKAEFLFDRQNLSFNQTTSLENGVRVEGEYKPMF
jgi:hypothetical protein